MIQAWSSEYKTIEGKSSVQFVLSAVSVGTGAAAYITKSDKSDFLEL